MGLKIAHFPTLKTLDEFEFKFQPSVDQRLIRELAAGHFITHAANVLIFSPGVGKTHLGDCPRARRSRNRALGLFTSATALLAAMCYMLDGERSFGEVRSLRIAATGPVSFELRILAASNFWTGGYVTRGDSFKIGRSAENPKPHVVEHIPKPGRWETKK
jgi:hypothetical protein